MFCISLHGGEVESKYLIRASESQNKRQTFATDNFNWIYLLKCGVNWLCLFILLLILLPLMDQKTLILNLQTLFVTVQDKQMVVVSVYV